MVAPMDNDDLVLPDGPADGPALSLSNGPVRPVIEPDSKGRKVLRWRLAGGQYARRDTTPEEAERVRLKTLEASRNACPPVFHPDFKVDLVIDHLNLRDDYEALMQRPSTHAKDLQCWLKDHGHPVCISAVRSHRAAYFKRIADIDETARLAEQFARIARRHGSGALAEAAAARYEQLFFKRLFHLSDDEAKKLEMKDWQTMQRVAAGMATTRKFVEEMRLQFEARARQAAKEVDLALTGKPAGQSVCDRVREILGIPLGDAPLDESDDRPAAATMDHAAAATPIAESGQNDPLPEATAMPVAPPPPQPTAIHPSRDRPRPRHVPFELSGW